MKNTTLCYIEHDGCFLMLHRNKKSNDLNAQKWIGVGGKFEPGENAEACLLREVFEETGLKLTSYEPVGLVKFISDTWEDEDMYLFRGTSFTGELISDCPEGTLKWVPISDVLSLPTWEGDRYFLRPMLEGKRGLCLTLRYEGETLVSVSDDSEPVVMSRSSVLKYPHAFSTRVGGVSDGIYATLNLGMDHGDIPERVAENWRRFMREAGLVNDAGPAVNDAAPAVNDAAPAVFGGRPIEHFVYGDQVHKNNVRIVTGRDALPICADNGVTEADGFVTAEPYCPVAVFTADCIPLLLEDHKAGVVGAVHCGWRSTVADIMENAVLAMESLGAHREDICAAVGAGIGACCFEVGSEVVEAAEKLLRKNEKTGAVMPEILSGSMDSSEVRYGEQVLWRRGNPGKYLLDLKGIVRERLIGIGIAKEHITVSEECTKCRPDRFFSHRYSGAQRGSLASMIMIKPDR